MTEEYTTIERYYSLKPTDFPILERLEIQQSMTVDEVSPPELRLEIKLRPRGRTDHRRLFLSFLGVRELQLRQPSWSEVQFTFLEINSTQTQQWENLRYKVKESEEDSLSFFCKRFHAAIKAD